MAHRSTVPTLSTNGPSFRSRRGGAVVTLSRQPKDVYFRSTTSDDQTQHINPTAPAAPPASAVPAVPAVPPTSTAPPVATTVPAPATLAHIRPAIPEPQSPAKDAQSELDQGMLFFMIGLGMVALVALVGGCIYLHQTRARSIVPQESVAIVQRPVEEQFESLSVRAGERGQLPVPMGAPDDFTRVMENTIVRAGDQVFPS